MDHDFHREEKVLPPSRYRLLSFPFLLVLGQVFSTVAAGQTEAFLFNDAISHWVLALRGLNNETEE